MTLRPVLGLAGLTLLALVIAACAPQVAPELLAAAAQNRTQPDVPAEAWAWPQAAEEVPLRPRPAGAPDVVVIAFAGHCGLVCRTRNTWSYLDDPGEATGEVAVLDAILRAFRRQSLTAEGISLSSFVEAHYSGISDRFEPGYNEAQGYLDFVKHSWIDGVANPTRVVLLGHSHGTVWATLLAMNNLDVTFDYLVSIDAICWQWWGRHARFVADVFSGQDRPIPFPLDQGDPCESLAIPGQNRFQDINDVVPANVIFGLEVRTPVRLFSLAPNVLRDDDPNMRINGTELNIWSIETFAAHNDVGRHYNPATAWVEAMITVLGLPDHAEFSMTDFVLPPAPEGFNYRYSRLLIE